MEMRRRRVGGGQGAEKRHEDRFVPSVFVHRQANGLAAVQRLLHGPEGARLRDGLLTSTYPDPVQMVMHRAVAPGAEHGGARHAAQGSHVAEELRDADVTAHADDALGGLALGGQKLELADIHELAQVALLDPRHPAEVDDHPGHVPRPGPAQVSCGLGGQLLAIYDAQVAVHTPPDALLPDP